MKTSELRQKNEGELKITLGERLAKLAELRFDLAGGKVKNLKAIREAKVDIARILTIQNQIRKINKN